MAKGFFPQSRLLKSKAPPSTLPKCGACQLHLHCKFPKQEPIGQGRKGILIVSEVPGRADVISRELQKVGVSLQKDCWLTSALICDTPTNTLEKKDLIKIEYCRPNLIKTIQRLKPKIIILLGSSAIKSLIGYLWKEDAGGFMTWVGFRIPSQRLGAWVCPMYHPLFIEHAKDKELAFSIFRRHLKKAVSIKKEVVVKSPLESQVRIIHDHRVAASQILEIKNSAPGYLAFDYETNCLKPDYSDASIVSASFCYNGHTTIAFPFHGEVKMALRDLLWRSPHKKIASNLKFEERWTIAEYGSGVSGWFWDTMLAAHWLDNRSGITSVKFQAFVRLGVDNYDDHIKPLLKSSGVTKLNKILSEVDLDHLLLYNGLDSLVEYLVAMHQMKEGRYVEQLG